MVFKTVALHLFLVTISTFGLGTNAAAATLASCNADRVAVQQLEEQTVRLRLDDTAEQVTAALVVQVDGPGVLFVESAEGRPFLATSQDCDRNTGLRVVRRSQDRLAIAFPRAGDFALRFESRTGTLTLLDPYFVPAEIVHDDFVLPLSDRQLEVRATTYQALESADFQAASPEKESHLLSFLEIRDPDATSRSGVDGSLDGNFEVGPVHADLAMMTTDGRRASLVARLGPASGTEKSEDDEDGTEEEELDPNPGFALQAETWVTAEAHLLTMPEGNDPRVALAGWWVELLWPGQDADDGRAKIRLLSFETRIAMRR